MILDIEALTIGYLKTREEITEMGARIVGETPNNTSTPWVRVLQIDPRAITPDAEEHFVNYMVQFDCYAGDGPTSDQMGEANLLTRRVRQALNEMRRASLDAVVSTVRFTSCPRLPDPDVGSPARQRYALTAEIYAHG